MRVFQMREASMTVWFLKCPVTGLSPAPGGEPGYDIELDIVEPRSGESGADVTTYRQNLGNFKSYAGFSIHVRQPQ